jgi:hypothetical protein
MSFFIDVLKSHNIQCPKTIIETGTYLGEGIKDYLSTRYFTKIISIEIANKYVLLNKEQFANECSVEILHGDSSTVLENLINNSLLPNQPVLFYLDAHFSGADTGGLDIDNGCPILRELKAISKRNIKGDIIFIDDMRLMGKNSTSGTPGCSKYPVTTFDFSHATTDKMIESLNRNTSIVTMCHGIDRMLIVLE